MAVFQTTSIGHKIGFVTSASKLADSLDVVNVFPSLSRNDAHCVLADVIKYFFNLILINYIIYENLSATQKIISTLIGVYTITEKMCKNFFFKTQEIKRLRLFICSFL